LDQGEWVTDLKLANWPEVIKQCSKLLQESSKDLRVAAWLTEAWMHEQGFAGLAKGYALINQLCARYWESVYPEAEAGDNELRIGHITWVLNHSARWIATIPVVERQYGGHGLSDFAAAHLRTGGTRLGEVAYVTLEQLEQARASSSVEFYQRLVVDVRAALLAMMDLDECLSRLLADDSPGFSGARDALERAKGTIERFAVDAGVQIQHPAAEVCPSTDIDAIGSPASVRQRGRAMGVAGGEISSRHDALQMLRKVAVYFRESEPHSPAGYLAEQAARWGDMPLHEWLKVVMKNHSTLAHVEEILGVEAQAKT
jgi:type VI secretion system protein ImpA